MPAPSRDEVSDEIAPTGYARPSAGYGREALFNRLAAASSRGRLSHAYLFVGPDNKLDMALFMARALCCTGPEGYPCGTCSACRRVQSYSHPDVTVVFWEQVRNQTGQVKEIQGEASLAPHEARCKIYILVDAHVMNVRSSNCLLKILEEAPEHAMFILLAPNVFSLLTTIVSRCQRLYVPPVAGAPAGEANWEGGLEAFIRIMAEERFEIMQALIDQWPVGLGRLEGIVSGSRDLRFGKEQRFLTAMYRSLERDDHFTLACRAEKLAGILKEHGSFISGVRNWQLVNETLNREKLDISGMIAAITKEGNSTEAGIYQRREVEELLRFSGRIVKDLVVGGSLPAGQLREWMKFFTETRDWIIKNLDSTLLLETAFFRLHAIFGHGISM